MLIKIGNFDLPRYGTECFIKSFPIIPKYPTGKSEILLKAVE